ncbi:MAG: YceI family protein [Alphaproteobacteria bacterium]
MMHTPELGFSAHGAVKRSDFNLGAFVPMVGDDVDIRIEAEFQKQADAK